MAKAMTTLAATLAARSAVRRRLGQGFQLAPGVTEDAAVARLTSELVELRAIHSRTRMPGTAIERPDEWLAHAPYEILINQLRGLFVPPTSADVA